MKKYSMKKKHSGGKELFLLFSPGSARFARRAVSQTEAASSRHR